MWRTSGTTWLIAMGLSVLTGPVLEAQDPDLILSVTDASGIPGSSFEVRCLFDNNAARSQGWSWGLCHDTDLLSVNSVVDGATTATVNQGGPPDFNQVEIVPGGWTLGVVICFVGCAVLDIGMGYELNIVNYTIIDEAPTVTELCYCSILGTPPVVVVFVFGGASFVPTQICGEVEILQGPDPFQYQVDNQEVQYDFDTGEASFTVTPTIVENELTLGFPNDVQGFSMGLAHDPAFLDVTNVVPFGEIAEMNEGNGPDLFIPTFLEDGFVVGTVFSFTGSEVVPFSEPKPVLEVTYDTVPGPLIGESFGI